MATLIYWFMSVFGEFRIPTDALALAQTFAAEPEAIIEIDRVVAAEEECLTPYFLVSGIPTGRFESAASDDDSIDRLRKLTESDDATLYRANWRDHVEALAHGYTRHGASILTAKGSADAWVLRMRFDDREDIDGFTDHLHSYDFSFELARMHEMTYSQTGSRFGLTPKQHEAMVTAWEMGYFDLPRDTSMEAVAETIGISPQSLSDRLRRAQYSLIGDTLRLSIE